MYSSSIYISFSVFFLFFCLSFSSSLSLRLATLSSYDKLDKEILLFLISFLSKDNIIEDDIVFYLPNTTKDKDGKS